MYEVRIRRKKIVLRIYSEMSNGVGTYADHEFDGNGASILADQLQDLADELANDEAEGGPILSKLNRDGTVSTV